MTERPTDATEMPRREFDELARAHRFADGPWISSFGDGYGEPYVPHRFRHVWGRLDDGRTVWAGVDRDGVASPVG